MQLNTELPRTMARASQRRRTGLVRGNGQCPRVTTMYITKSASIYATFTLALVPYYLNTRGLRAPEKTTHVNYTANQMTKRVER